MRISSTAVDRETWLHGLSVTPLSTSSETYQVVKLQKDFFQDMYTI